MNRSPHPPLTIRESLNRFFFEEQVPFGAALTRMFLPLAALLPMLMRFPRVRELYSTDGTPVQMFELFGNGEFLPVLPPGAATMLYSLMLFSMACAIIGWNTRLSLAVGTSLYCYFNLLDGVGTMTKYSVIASHLLLLLTLSPCGKVWSVDEWLRKRKSGESTRIPQAYPVWATRLMQLLFAFIYFGAAITKIQTEAFFSGEQMRYWMLSNWNYENPVGELVAMWTPILLVSAYLTVVWEILFGFLVWNPRLRLIMLGAGAMFHLGTWLLLGLYIFPAICLSGYLAFAQPQDVFRVRRWLRSLRIRPSLPAISASRVPSLLPAGVTWVICAGIFALTAMEAEVRLDLYGMNSPSGPMPLQELDREHAMQLIGSETPLREKDKFFSFHVGSVAVGGQLANRRDSFEFGETLLAECNLNPPHEDMWVECVLEDDEQHVLDTTGQVITREQLRGHFYYRLGSRLTPGSYNLVLRSAGEEITRRSFTLSGEPCTLDSAVYGN